MPYWPIVHAQHFFPPPFHLWTTISLMLGDVRGHWKHFTLLFKEAFVLKAWAYSFTRGGKANEKASFCPWVHIVGALSCSNKSLWKGPFIIRPSCEVLHMEMEAKSQFTLLHSPRFLPLQCRHSVQAPSGHCRPSQRIWILMPYRFPCETLPASPCLNQRIKRIKRSQEDEHKSCPTAQLFVRVWRVLSGGMRSWHNESLSFRRQNQISSPCRQIHSRWDSGSHKRMLQISSTHRKHRNVDLEKQRNGKRKMSLLSNWNTMVLYCWLLCL